MFSLKRDTKMTFVAGSVALKVAARKLTFLLACSVMGTCLAVPAVAVGVQNQGTATAPAPKSKVKAVGTIKTIDGSAITLTPDTGAEVVITIQPSTRLFRAMPGETNFKLSVPAQLQELQVGDRLLVGGTAAEDSKSILASTAIVMKKADIAAKQEQEREGWQKRGVGGVVKKIDPVSGSITISTGTLSSDTVVVQVSKDTVLRRYAPDSVKFDDAKPGTLAQIKLGDQLRARGARSSDAKELAAEEVVSGSFRSIAGTMVATDASNNTVTVLDLATKRPVTMKITADSQLHKLPAMVAQRIAMSLKGGVPSGAANSPAAGAGPQAAHAQATGGGTGAGARAGGPADFQRMLSRMPAITPAELQKGEALMIVATEGSADSPSTVIILLSGVEPILAAAPSQASTILSPWNLGGGAAAASAGDAP